MTLGEIIKAYRDEHHLSMADFARASGLSKTYIWMLESNRNPSSKRKTVVPTIETIQKAAKGMFISFDDLFDKMGDDTLVRLEDSVVGKKAVQIPVLGRVAAGVPISAVEDILDYEDISDDMARTGKFFALKIKGDSMMPKIENGSVVIVRQQEDAESGNIVVALVNGNDAVCKKLVKSDRGISLVSLNPNYDPMYYSSEDITTMPVRIIGKVVEIRTKCE